MQGWDQGLLDFIYTFRKVSKHVLLLPKEEKMLKNTPLYLTKKAIKI